MDMGVGVKLSNPSEQQSFSTRPTGPFFCCLFAVKSMEIAGLLNAPIPRVFLDKR